MSNQGGRIQAWAEAAGVEPAEYEETFHLMADSMGIAPGEFNERMVLYLQDITGDSNTHVEELMSLVATQLGVYSWNGVGYNIGDLSASRFVFNGVDQYVLLNTAIKEFGNPVIYSEITYSATNDQGYVTDYVLPLSEYGRVLPNYHNGEIWNFRYTDQAPIQDTFVKGSSVGTIPDMLMENGIIEFDYIVDGVTAGPNDVIPGFFQDNTGFLFVDETNGVSTSLEIDGIPVANGTQYISGQHIHVKFATQAGTLNTVAIATNSTGMQELRLSTVA